MSWPGGDDRLDLSSLGVFLDQGEQVRWSGRPTRTPLVFRGRDAFLIPFSVIWGGFAVFWNVGVWSTGSRGFSLFGLPFLLVGAYVTVGRFVHNWVRRYRTTYLLTDRRALIAGDGFGRRVREHHLAGSLGVETRLGRNGTGTIVFESADSFGSMFGNNRNAWGDWSSAGVDGFQFYRVADVETAIRIVRSASNAARDRRRSGSGSLHQIEDTPGWSSAPVDDSSGWPGGASTRWSSGPDGDSTGRPAPSPWRTDPPSDHGGS